MLSPRMMFLAGAGLVALGVLSYVLMGGNWNAAIVGIALGIAVIALADIGGGPRPVPRGGYSFETAMALFRRATLGALVMAMVITALGFFLWIRGSAGPTDVLVLFALGLVVVYTSIIAAGSLVIVGHMTREPEEER